MTRPPPPSTLFPYTTLFRSLADAQLVIAREHDCESWPKFVQRLRSLSGETDTGAIWKAAEHAVIAGEIERSEEHTSELQSRRDLVCRLLREKKKRAHVPRGA